MAFHQFNPSCPVIVGCGSVAVIGDKIKEHGCKKPFICTDEGVYNAGIIDKVTAVLKDSGLEYGIFKGVHPDPSAELVDEAVEAALAFGADCLIGVGGGSSMDTAKAASIRLSGFEGKTADYVLAVPPTIPTTTPVFLMPTTTGTGSECTKVAVISRPEFNVKWSVFVRTTLAIIDPTFTVTLPRQETANTGLDALAHATEALTSKDANVHSDYYAVGAIKKIGAYLLKSWQEPKNLEYRTNMATAANWAGLAFADPMCHLGHAIGDAFGCNFHTHHGHSCSLGLAEVMRLVAPVVPEKMAIVANAMGLPVKGGETGAELGDMVADFIYGLMRQMEFVSLKSMGISRERVVACAQEVVDNHLSGYAPLKITLEIAQDILGKIYDNYQ